MDEPDFSERPSVLGDPDLPNANRRVIAVVLGTCAVAFVLLILVVSIVIEQRLNRPESLDDGSRRSDASAVARRAPPVADPRLANTPAHGNPVTAFSADDYPADAQRRGEQGRTVARLRLDAAGTPIGCVVATSSGSPSLDATTCRIALAKVRYSPARDQTGRPIASSVALPVRWVLPDEPPALPPPGEGDPPPFWLPPLLAMLAAFEGFAAYRGWTTGRVTAPRSSSILARRTAPVLFITYVALHIVLALALAAGAIISLFV